MPVSVAALKEKPLLGRADVGSPLAGTPGRLAIAVPEVGPALPREGVGDRNGFASGTENPDEAVLAVGPATAVGDGLGSPLR